ncbi:hypothetical protein AB9128_12605 [Streptomyces cinereoruber]|uniref:hypothetical protein n=1 Tax=Streptomyces cinereoruber TaxID=67260 RepID=UPI003EBFBB3A
MTALDAKPPPEVSAALAPPNARLKGLPGAPVRRVAGQRSHLTRHPAADPCDPDEVPVP